MVQEYLTKEEIIQQLKNRWAGRKFVVFWKEVMNMTGMDVSYSHLFNIVRGVREPNEVVMKYLGGTVEKSVVYQIQKPTKRGKRNHG
jgi:hypothetical protein